MKTATMTLILLGMVALSCLGTAEAPCIPCMQGASVNSSLRGKIVPEENTEDPVYQVETQEAMEWQCIIVDIIIGDCIDWESRPCDYCYAPLYVGCNIFCAAALTAGCAAVYANTGIIPVWCNYLGAACILVPCDEICSSACPQCSYCVEYDITIITSCGWVFTE